LGPRPLDSRSKPTIRRRARRSTSRCHSRAAELLTRQPAFLQRPAPATRFRRAGGDDVPLRKGGMSYRTISRRARSGCHRSCAMPSPGFPKLLDPNTYSRRLCAPESAQCEG
jgi:hypothetical protein